MPVTYNKEKRKKDPNDEGTAKLKKTKLMKANREKMIPLNDISALRMNKTEVFTSKNVKANNNRNLKQKVKVAKEQLYNLRECKQADDVLLAEMILRDAKIRLGNVALSKKTPTSKEIANLKKKVAKAEDHINDAVLNLRNCRSTFRRAESVADKNSGTELFAKSCRREEPKNTHAEKAQPFRSIVDPVIKARKGLSAIEKAEKRMLRAENDAKKAEEKMDSAAVAAKEAFLDLNAVIQLRNFANSVSDQQIEMGRVNASRNDKLAKRTGGKMIHPALSVKNTNFLYHADTAVRNSTPVLSRKTTNIDNHTIFNELYGAKIEGARHTKFNE